MSVKHWWSGIDGKNQSTLRNTCRRATLSTTNHTWTCLGSNLGLYGKWSPTDHQIHETV